jgi:hypothetical protein
MSARNLLCDMLSDRAADLTANTAVASIGQPRDCFGKVGFDPRADVNQMFVDGVVHGL